MRPTRRVPLVPSPDLRDWDALPAGLRDRLPPRVYAVLDAYVRHAAVPNRFLRAVLESDVAQLSRCQPLSLLSLGAVVDALAYAPQECYGSPEIVSAWLKANQREGAVIGSEDKT